MKKYYLFWPLGRSVGDLVAVRCSLFAGRWSLVAGRLSLGGKI